MGEILGQSIVIENRPGTGGNVGSEAVASAPADGSTLLYGALNEPAVVERLAARGAVAIYSTPEAQLAHITKELPMWAGLVKDSGAKVDWLS